MQYSTFVHTHRLRIIALASAAFWAALLLHIYVMFAEPLPDHEGLRRFAERFRLASSLQLLALVVPGIALSLWAGFRRSARAAAALACVAAVTFWWMYVSGVSVFFRPPMGDGSFEAALGGWWRLHSPALGWHAAKISLLAASIVLWLSVCVRLSRRTRGAV